MLTVEEIKKLIHKNKKRLYTEILASKELFILLKKSTHKKLSDQEKNKVKAQLLEILKGIPAFAIFMLPGGIILLPLVIKLIPDILPNSFRDN